MEKSISTTGDSPKSTGLGNCSDGEPSTTLVLTHQLKADHLQDRHQPDLLRVDAHLLTLKEDQARGLLDLDIPVFLLRIRDHRQVADLVHLRKNQEDLLLVDALALLQIRDLLQVDVSAAHKIRDLLKDKDLLQVDVSAAHKIRDLLKATDMVLLRMNQVDHPRHSDDNLLIETNLLRVESLIKLVLKVETKTPERNPRTRLCLLWTKEGHSSLEAKLKIVLGLLLVKLKTRCRTSRETHTLLLRAATNNQEIIVSPRRCLI